MKQLYMEDFYDFLCVGSSCKDTCCAGWKVYIDPETRKFYENVEGEFGDELRSAMEIREDGVGVFRLNNNLRCNFLNEENLCRIYRKLGPKHMCDICRNYPRMVYQSGDVMFAALSISCPEVGRTVLERREPQKFVYTDNEQPISDKDVDWELFDINISTWTTMDELLQQRAYPIGGRLGAALICAYQVHSLLSEGEDVQAVLDLFQKPELYSNVIDQLAGSEVNITSMIRFVRISIAVMIKMNVQPLLIKELHRFQELFTQKDRINAERWIEAFDVINKGIDETEFEQMLVYLLFRNFMEGYEKTSIWERMMRITVFYLIYRSMIVLHYMGGVEIPDKEQRILLAVRISRQFEHSRDTWKEIVNSFRQEGADTLEFFLGIIC